MTLAYVKPGVSISEVVSPAFAPFVSEPTSICVVGPAQGYENHVEVFVLDDNAPVTLQATGVDTTSISVVDASNVTLTPFSASTSSSKKDYDIDASTLATDGLVKISRAMQTTIKSGEKVTVYFENSGAPVQSDGKTELLTLTRTNPVTPVNAASATQGASLKVMSAGRAPAGDYTITGAGTGAVTITRNGGATVLGKFQTVYMDYTVGSTLFSDVAVQLNATTTVNLPANSTAHIVKTAPGAGSNTAVLYSKGATTDLDYIVTGSGATTAIARSAGTTTMGTANDQLAVRVSYRATPFDYWLPTKCFSQSDVENKFGPAFDSQGNILNSVSFGASLAFQNGASSVIVQALFSQTNGINGAPTGAAADWQVTLNQLRAVSEINVIVPLISTGNLTANDATSLLALQAVQDHIYFMSTTDSHVVGVFGEDSTKAGLASMTVLRNHAQALAARPKAENVVLLAPAAFTFSNPVTGNEASMGGQFVACAIAGQLAARPVQEAITRKILVGVSSVRERRLEQDKLTDAANGLLVVENFSTRVRVRHGITVVTTNINAREINVVRAKHFMIRSVREAIDEQIIGQIPLDGSAPFRVQLLVTSVLEELVNSGAIVTYRGVQARRNPNDPTAIDVRYSYLPAYPLNYVNIQFSIDSSQGLVTTEDAAASAAI